MDRETGDLVAEPLGGDDDDFFKDVVVVEVDGHAQWPGLLHSLGAAVVEFGRFYIYHGELGFGAERSGDVVVFMKKRKGTVEMVVWVIVIAGSVMMIE
ncbi:hypothetical protein M0R45_006448 [Rubus argutus]|uniref:Uncharacterized protein n=1 Tax=Rubus argutus TaxID=59490 RepID=A0AAW1YQM4_RUBAR